MNELRVDPVAIAHELGIPRPRLPVRFEGGSDTVVWRVETDDGPAAVRVFREEQWQSAHRERQALAAADEAGIPVPAVRAAGTPASAGGRPVTVLQWSDGTTVLNRLVHRPREAERLGELLGRTQAAIHRAMPPTEWEPRAEDRLLHFDLHPSNVLVEDERVSAVLDWVNARAGDPRTDVARTYAILVADPAGVAYRHHHPREAGAFRHGWRAGYEGAAQPLDGMASFIAEAGGWMRGDLARRLDDVALGRMARWATGWRRRARGDDPGEGREATGT